MDISSLMEETAEVRSTYKNLLFIMQVFTEKLTPSYKAKAILLASKAQAEAETGAEAGTDNEPEEKDETALLLADLLESWKNKPANAPDDAPAEEVTLHGQPFPPAYESLIQLSYPLLTTLLKDVTTFLGSQANPQSPNA
jgi:hypothetical protein